MGSPRKQAFIRLDATGDGSGSTSMKVNGSVTPVDFRFDPGEWDRGNFRLYQLQLYIQTLTDPRDPTKFGDLAGLTNGIQLSIRKISDDSLVEDLFLSVNEAWPAEGSARDHSDLRSLGFATEFSQFAGALQWISFDKEWTDPDSGALYVYADEYMQLKVNDNLTGLTVFNSFMAGVFDK